MMGTRDWKESARQLPFAEGIREGRTSGSAMEEARTRHYRRDTLPELKPSGYRCGWYRSRKEDVVWGKKHGLAVAFQSCSKSPLPLVPFVRLARQNSMML